MSLKVLVSLLGCIICFAKVTIAQTNGCTDFRANNFNKNADINDGSCTYDATSCTPLRLVEKLSDTINETSGLLNINGELWTFGDSGNPNAIYHFDKITGAILQTLVIKNAVNHDWEEITADANFIYIGDFGNNDGNRTNLTIYKFAKSLITTKILDSITAEKIQFSYTDQKIFSSRHNANRYDCEAMFVWKDTLHLFSKDWVDGHSRHFLLSTVPGIYTITPIDSFEAGCLITGACIDPVSKRIVLIGYNKTGFCYLWLLWDFKNSQLFSGNKRKIDLGFFIHTGQTEGVCFNDSNNIYFTNELVPNWVDNKLYGAEVGAWMNPRTPGVAIENVKQEISTLKLFPNPATTELTLTYNLRKPSVVSYCIYDNQEKLVYCSKSRLNGGNITQKINIANLSGGNYYLIVHSDKMNSERKQFIKQ